MNKFIHFILKGVGCGTRVSGHGVPVTKMQCQHSYDLRNMQCCDSIVHLCKRNGLIMADLSAMHAAIVRAYRVPFSYSARIAFSTNTLSL